MRTGRITRAVAAACALAVVASGCSFDGLNSLPLPGTVGTGSGALHYQVEIANIGTLESNSPVMVNDVVVGAVGTMVVDDWRAHVDLSVRPDVVVPANAVATVGQTSLLGSMHLALDPPVGRSPPVACPPAPPSRWTGRRPTRPPSRRCRRWRWSSTAAA